MNDTVNWDEDVDFAYRVASRVLREVGAFSEIEDLRGCAALALCECRQRYDESLGVSFRTFAYLRIRGAVLDELRKKFRRSAWETTSSSAYLEKDEVEEYASPLPGPLEHCERQSLRQLLELLVTRLSPNEREVIRLLYFCDYTPDEASKLLGGKSKSWISRYHRDALFSLQLILREGETGARQ